MTRFINALTSCLAGLAIGVLLSSGSVLDNYTGPTAAMQILGVLALLIVLALLLRRFVAWRVQCAIDRERLQGRQLPPRRSPPSPVPLHCVKNSRDVAPCETHSRRIRTFEHSQPGKQ